MKHILGFNEALKGKGLSSYDIDTTDYRRDRKRLTKKEYSGSLMHWRKVEDENTKAWENNGKKSLSYQFAWKQKLQKIDTGYYQPTKDQEYRYPDFNYNSNAMICKLNLYPYYLDRNKYYLRISFDSIDDDIMYDGEKMFDTFEEGEAQMKIVMKVFEKKFREVYPKGSVRDATFDEMSKYFDMF